MQNLQLIIQWFDFFRPPPSSTLWKNFPPVFHAMETPKKKYLLC